MLKIENNQTDIVEILYGKVLFIAYDGEFSIMFVAGTVNFYELLSCSNGYGVILDKWCAFVLSVP